MNLVSLIILLSYIALSLLYCLYLLLRRLFQGIGVKDRLIRELDFYRADFGNTASPGLHSNIKCMASMLSVIGDKMQVPSGRIDPVHVIREIHTDKSALYRFKLKGLLGFSEYGLRVCF